MLAVVTIVCAGAALWMSRAPIVDHVASWIAPIQQQAGPRVADRPAATSRNVLATPGRPARSIVSCARNCVTDGDTFRLGDERIRIVGIDAPEMQGRCAEETVLANKAKRRLRDLIEGRTLLIERQGTDRFGRTLADVRAGGRDVGQRLVAEGLARKWTGAREPWCTA